MERLKPAAVMVGVPSTHQQTTDPTTWLRDVGRMRQRLPVVALPVPAQSPFEVAAGSGSDGGGGGVVCESLRSMPATSANPLHAS